MNFRAVIATAALATTLIAGAAGAQTVTLPGGATINGPVGVTSPSYNHRRGERGSNRNIRSVRVRLEKLIDNLQNDRRDYDGHRINAINLMRQARTELLQAEAYDRAHPGQ